MNILSIESLVDDMFEVATNRSVSEAKGCVEAVTKSAETCQFLCKAAAEAYEMAEKAHTWQGILYHKLASETEFSKQMIDQFVRPVLRVIDGDATKEAFIKTLPAMAGGRLAAMSPNALKYLMTAGIATGLVGGGLTWKAKREIEEDESAVAKLKARVDYYDKITRDLDEQLMRNSTTREV